MAALRWSRVGAGTETGRDGVVAPSRSTMDTTDAATMAVTTVPPATSRASQRPLRARAARAPPGGRASRDPACRRPQPRHEPPPTRPAAQVAGIVVRPVNTAHPEAYLVRPGHGGRPPPPLVVC